MLTSRNSTFGAAAPPVAARVSRFRSSCFIAAPSDTNFGSSRHGSLHLVGELGDDEVRIFDAFVGSEHVAMHQNILKSIERRRLDFCRVLPDFQPAIAVAGGG